MLQRANAEESLPRAKNQLDTTVNSGGSETAMNTYETVARSYDGNKESLPKVKNQYGTATKA